MTGCIRLSVTFTPESYEVKRETHITYDLISHCEITTHPYAYTPL